MDYNYCAEFRRGRVMINPTRAFGWETCIPDGSLTISLTLETAPLLGAMLYLPDSTIIPDSNKSSNRLFGSFQMNRHQPSVQFVAKRIIDTLFIKT